MKKIPSGLVPLVAVDRNAPTPIHRQIYEAYRGGIVGGNLRSGQRVPSTRALAEELGVDVMDPNQFSRVEEKEVAEKKTSESSDTRVNEKPVA